MLTELILLTVLSAGCTRDDIQLGTCTSVIPGGVEIIVDEIVPGIGPAPEPPAPPPYMLPDGTCNRVDYPLCRDVYEVTGPMRAIDIATFHAAAGTATMTPDGWTLVGRPLTARASASIHEVGGTLLARPAVVRFTPSGFAWDFGDGSTARSTPAAPSTAHEYRRSGRFTIAMTVEYAAEYRWADSGDWVPVIGTVTVPSVSMPVQVRSVTAVLVPGDCERYPDDPGC